MILICVAQVSLKCQKTMTRHGTSAITKEHVCPFCSAAMNTNPALREQYNASILKGDQHVAVKSTARVRK